MMILQSCHVVIDCPICGRPLEMQSPLVSHEVACGHCCGEFVVHETGDGSLTTANRAGTDYLERAEQLLRVAVDTNITASKNGQQRFPLVSIPDIETRPDDSLSTSLEDIESEAEPQPTVLLVEQRDEVFARIATDIALFGIRVIRAKSATEALELYDTYEPTLLVANVDLPDQSGWLMTAKLRLVDRKKCVWLYQHQPSNYGRWIASFLNVDALLDYRGDLLSLSETIVNLMDSRCEPHDGSSDSGKAEESAAA